MSDEERRLRAEARARTMTVRKAQLGDEQDLRPIFGAEAISLVTRLTRSCWSLGGMATSPGTRDEMPVRFVPRTCRA